MLTSLDQYFFEVREEFRHIGYKIESIHDLKTPVTAIREAQAIVVGGGNTFKLLHSLYDQDILGILRDQVKKGIPYIGWSAGANIACPTIQTTNDMPIVEPTSLSALNLIPFQINPHYLDSVADGYTGESRVDRISEYLEINDQKYVLALREGNILKIENNMIELLGEREACVFVKGKGILNCSPRMSLQFLMN